MQWCVGSPHTTNYRLKGIVYLKLCMCGREAYLDMILTEPGLESNGDTSVVHLTGRLYKVVTQTDEQGWSDMT